MNPGFWPLSLPPMASLCRGEPVARPAWELFCTCDLLGSPGFPRQPLLPVLPHQGGEGGLIVAPYS